MLDPNGLGMTRNILNNASSFLRRMLCLQTLWAGILAVGIILYFRQYLANRPLWLDEAMVAANILRCSVLDFLHHPLPYWQQMAPFGFLLVEKGSVFLFGTSEYALRLYPFLAACVSLWLFLLVARRYLPRDAVALGLLGFVLNPFLIYYSSEVKPYGTDVFWVLLVYAVVAPLCDEDLRPSRILILGILGAGMLWCSYTSVFVLGGLAVTVLGEALIRQDRRRLGRLAGMVSFWAVSFAVFYVFSLGPIYLLRGGEVVWWRSGVVALTDAGSWGAVAGDILRFPLGFPKALFLPAGGLFLAGAYTFFRRDPKKFFLLFMPIFLAVLASAIRRYTLKERLVLFLVPIVWIVIAQGIRTVSALGRRYTMAVACVVLGILLAAPALSVWKGFWHPDPREDVRKALAYLQAYRWEEDAVCLYQPARPAVEYYAPRYGLSLEDRVYNLTVWGRRHRLAESLKKDLDRLQGIPRAWMVFAHVERNGREFDNRFCTQYLLRAGGRRLDVFRARGVIVYLFDLTRFDGWIAPPDWVSVWCPALGPQRSWQSDASYADERWYPRVGNPAF